MSQKAEAFIEEIRNTPEFAAAAAADAKWFEHLARPSRLPGRWAVLMATGRDACSARLCRVAAARL